jgi:hypothetical protein
MLLATLALAAQNPDTNVQRWFCTATDYAGSIGAGNGSTREQAETMALLNCNARGRGACSTQSCQQI